MTAVGLAVGRGDDVGDGICVGCAVGVGASVAVGIGATCLVCPVAIAPQEARTLTRKARERTTIKFFISVPRWDCEKRL